jgi:hypothetical protein
MSPGPRQRLLVEGVQSRVCTLPVSLCACVYLCVAVPLWVDHVCAQMKMNMLSMSCLCPALVPLVSNLIVSDDTSPSAFDEPWIQVRPRPRAVAVPMIAKSVAGMARVATASPWVANPPRLPPVFFLSATCLGAVRVRLTVCAVHDTCVPHVPHLHPQNYVSGKGFEVYRTSLSPSFYGMPFLEIAKLVYEETSTVRARVAQKISSHQAVPSMRARTRTRMCVGVCTCGWHPGCAGDIWAGNHRRAVRPLQDPVEPWGVAGAVAGSLHRARLCHCEG